MEPAMLQQLPVGLDPLQQQQFQHFQHVQRTQQRQTSRTHAVPVSSIPPQYHDLQQRPDRLAFYPDLTPVTPVGNGNAFSQTPISTVPTNFTTQPALSQPHQVIYSNAYGGLQPQPQTFPAPIPPTSAPVLAPTAAPVPPPAPRQVKRRNVVQEAPSQPADDGTFSTSNFEGLKLIPNPPNLKQWRQRLFDVDMLILLTEDEFQTYFPHADNIYSHRSTQRYKNKPFVSHYFDCRLKGRPAGTPKSEDPTKKKRKRSKRERDLCDVKIKITEFMAGATRDDIQAHLNLQPRSSDFRAEDILARVNAEAMATAQASFDSATPPLVATKRFYTVQRVNGTGAGGTRGEQICPNHRHTLEESDRIKKNSVLRAEIKKTQKEKLPPVKEKSYHTKATGNAWNTVKRHFKENDLQLYGSCFCPFVQRVWISLEHKKVPYQYIEIDPYAKPKVLLDINPRGLIPALKHGDWGMYESTVLMEYLEDLQQGFPLLPSDPKQRAHSRLWTDHINRHIIPAFYRYLQEQDMQKIPEHAEAFQIEIKKLVEAADPEGPFFLGKELSFVDVQFAPWVIRLRRVLTPYRAWQAPESGTRWARWVDAIEGNEAVKATTNGDELYFDSYERYAENRPNTSQLANAINSGRGLP